MNKAPDSPGKSSFDPNVNSKQAIMDTINETGHYQVAGEINAPANTAHAQTVFDLIILGGGAAAFAAAIYANEQSLFTLVINAGLPDIRLK